MRLGVIGSSGGAALAGAVDCLISGQRGIELLVVSDRRCGILEWADRQGYENKLIAYADAGTFSAGALDWLQARRVENVLMFFTRRVDSPLLGTVPVFNVHPSLLPAFPGLHSLEDSISAGARIVGATLHAADAGLDTGPIVAQISCGLPLECAAETGRRVSYLQKVYLTLLWYELLLDFGLKLDLGPMTISYSRMPPSALCASPCLSDPALVGAFSALQEKEGCRVI